MRLYHGSNTDIKAINLDLCRPYKENDKSVFISYEKSGWLVKKGRCFLMNKEQLMIEYMVQDVVEMIAETQKIEYDIAMKIVYESQIYEKIVDVETGLYRESPSYVYELLQDELCHGHIVQAEV